MIPVIYYAHSMRTYNTEREQRELALLQEHFQNGLIYNPNRPYISQHDEPMKACFEALGDHIITGLAFSHTDRKVPSGVYVEIRFAQKLHKPLYIIDHDHVRIYVGVVKLTKHDRATNWAEV